MQILYKDLNGHWGAWTCKLSGRTHFDLHEGWQKARWAVQNRWADETVLLDNAEIKARFEWDKQRSEAILREGIDLR